MISFFHFLTKKLRLSNPWRYKVPLILSFCYFLLLAGNVDAKTSALHFFAAIATTIGFMGFGYLINDLSDRKKDHLAGKGNGTANLSNGWIAFLIIMFSMIAILPWQYLPNDRVSGICLAIEFALFLLYSLPPFRLKERGILGVVTDALYAHVMPAFLASWTFFLVGNKTYDDFSYFLITLSVWQFISGVRNIVSHQYKDYENDVSSKTKTLATKIGKDRTYGVMKNVLVPMEIFSLLPFLWMAQYKIDLLFVAIIVFGLTAFSNFRKGHSETPLKHFTNCFLDRFYLSWFPYIVIFSIVLRNNEFWWLLVFHFLLFNSFSVIKGWFPSKETDRDTVKRRIAILTTNRHKYLSLIHI